MPEELQHLLDRIQTEAVDKAEQDSGKILSQAKDKAASIVADAELKAKERLVQADKEAEAFAARSTKTLEQAARDLLITVGQGVENILADIVDESADKALDVGTLQQMLVKMAEAYVARGGSETAIDVLLSEADQQQVAEYFKSSYRSALTDGMTLHSNNAILKGFQVTFKDGKVYHDFSREAISEALSALLRPQLSEIVHRVARESAEDAQA